MTRLRVRVTDDLGHAPRKIEVLNEAGDVLGDLSWSVSEVRVRMTGPQVAILSIDFAVENAIVEGLA